MGCVTCHKCDDLIDIDKNVPEYDEGLDAYFCDIDCLLSFYRQEYDRLVKKNNELSWQCNEAKMNLDKTEKELKTVYDSARQGLLACGIGVVA